MLSNPAFVDGWSMTYVFDEAVPWLREQGLFDDDVFRTVFVDNPRDWLTA